MKERLVSLAKSRYFIPTIMMVISLSLVAYAATSVQVHNTVTITSGGSIQIVYRTTAFPGTCQAETGYSTSYTTPFSFTEPAGGSNNTYLCVNNIGTGSDTPTISITSGDPNNCPGACFTVTPSTLPTIPPGDYSAPTTLTISNHFTSAQVTPFDLVITVT